MADAQKINGNQYSWSSIEVRIDDEPYYGFTNVTYSDKRERVKAYGTGAHYAPRGRSAGKYSAEAKLTGWKSSVQALRAALAAKSSDGVSYGNVTFQVIVQYVEDGSEEPLTIELVDCCIASQDASDEENPDPLKEDIGLDIMYIKRNDLTLFDNSDGAR